MLLRAKEQLPANSCTRSPGQSRGPQLWSQGDGCTQPGDCQHQCKEHFSSAARQRTERTRAQGLAPPSPTGRARVCPWETKNRGGGCFLSSPGKQPNPSTCPFPGLGSSGTAGWWPWDMRFAPIRLAQGCEPGRDRQGGGRRDQGTVTSRRCLEGSLCGL